MGIRGWKRIAGLLVALAALLAPSSARAADELSWEVELLPVADDWDIVTAYKVNSRGWVVGDYTLEGEWFLRERSVLWMDGTYVELATQIGLPAGKVFSQAVALNDVGLVAGTAYDLNGSTMTSPQTAVLWDVPAGEVYDLHPASLGFDRSYVNDLNDAGHKVGSLMATGPTGALVGWRAYRWLPGTTSAGSLLPFPAGSDFTVSSASAINERGLIAGWIQPTIQSATPHATVWLPDGRVLDLHAAVQALAGDVTRSQAIAVDDAGRVVGQGWTSTYDRDVPWSWTEEGGVQLLDTGGENLFLVFGTESWYADLVAGSAGDYLAADERAAVWIDGVLTRLPIVSGYANMQATAISSKGVLAGIVLDDMAWWLGCKPFIAHPAPDPARLVARLLGRLDLYDLPHGLHTALAAKLEAAARALARGSTTAAAGALQAFLNLVEAQRGNQIPADLAELLAFDAEEIRDLIE